MKNFIPKEFRFAHKFSFFLHDLLVQTIKEGEKAGVFNVIIKFDSEMTKEKFSKMTSEELWNWLSHNDKITHYTLIYKQVILALLSDFCHFVYEGLKTSEKGKLTVSYALFRKPFKDNLLIFEWLVADIGDFLHKFYNDDSELYNPQRLSEERRKEIIKTAIEKSKNPNFDFTADAIFDLRYNRDDEFGFSNVWDKATHLVTSFKKLRTEKQNLNFVFLSEASNYSKWEHLYHNLPILLLHTFLVVESLLKTFAQRDSTVKDVAFDQCHAGYILWTNSLGIETEIPLNKVTIGGECDNCKSTFKMSGKRFLQKIFNTGFYKCADCPQKYYMNDVN